jgi:hypothetical protein
MEVEQRYIKFFVEERMKEVKIIDRLNKHDGWDALQRTQVHRWIKEVKSGRKDLPKVRPLGRAPDERPGDCIGKTLREDPHLSTRRLVKPLNINSATGRNYLTKPLGMKCYHLR